jgi:hypothetical protein
MATRPMPYIIELTREEYRSADYMSGMGADDA